MTLDTWLTFCVASTALLLIPGPTVLLVLSYALSRGRSVALACTAGVALGDLIAMTASLAGLGALVLASATLFTILKWVGAVYLVWLGIKMLISAGKLSDTQADTALKTRDNNVLWHATAVTALNPKSIAFFIAFVPQFITVEAPILPQFAILIATFVTLASINALIYAMLASAMRKTIRKPSVITWLTRTGGAMLIGMGVMTATLKRAT